MSSRWRCSGTKKMPKYSSIEPTLEQIGWDPCPGCVDCEGEQIGPGITLSTLKCGKCRLTIDLCQCSSQNAGTTNHGEEFPE